MKLNIISPGNRCPDWVNAGFTNYAKRIVAPFSLSLTEIPSEKRNTRNNIIRIKEKEAEKILAKINPHNKTIALDLTGKQFSTEELAEQLKQWQPTAQGIDFLIGGTDGLSPICFKKSNEIWALSKLTLPHMLVRVLLAEQLYRATSIIKNHPYHRG